MKVLHSKPTTFRGSLLNLVGLVPSWVPLVACLYEFVNSWVIFSPRWSKLLTRRSNFFFVDRNVFLVGQILFLVSRNVFLVGQIFFSWVEIFSHGSNTWPYPVLVEKAMADYASRGSDLSISLCSIHYKSKYS